MYFYLTKALSFYQYDFSKMKIIPPGGRHMFTQELADKIKQAVDSSDRQFWTAELHLQIIKYANEMKTLTGKEFCEQLGIPFSYGTEFSKMKKIADRLIQAGLDVSKI
jgi:hypothetical protein|nr:unnamed protein product [uncultured bacterium]